MDINCKNCGKRIEAESLFCTYCGAENTPGEVEISAPSTSMKVSKRTIRIVVCFGLIAVFIAIMAILNANLLMPWQIEAHVNKKAILSYAEMRYPDAIMVKEHYSSLEFNPWKSSSVDYITFEQDGLRFNIIADGGKVLVDAHDSAKAIAQFDEIIQDGFMKPRGITAQSVYWFSDAIPNDSPYTGGLGIAIGVYDQGSTPQEVGWLYDFYEYWRSEGVFLKSYSVSLNIIVNHNRKYHMDYGKNSDFPNEDEFYAAFKQG